MDRRTRRIAAELRAQVTDACKSCHGDFRAKESEHDQMDHEHHE